MANERPEKELTTELPAPAEAIKPSHRHLGGDAPKISFNNLDDLDGIGVDLVPDADSTRDLGSSTKYWAEGYIDSLKISGDLTIGSNLIKTDVGQGQIQYAGILGIGTAPVAGTDLVIGTGGIIALREASSTPTAVVNYGRLWTDSNNRAYFQDGSGASLAIGRLSLTDTIVFSGLSPAGAFQDLNLSGIVGANPALVMMKIKHNGDPGGQTYAVRTNGVGDGPDFVSGQSLEVIAVTETNYNAVLTKTDAAGIIEWYCDNATTTELKIIAYLK